jgi:hypothetical protein
VVRCSSAPIEDVKRLATAREACRRPTRRSAAGARWWCAPSKPAVPLPFAPGFADAEHAIGAVVERAKAFAAS